MNKLITETSNREFLDVLNRMAVIAQFRVTDIDGHLERVRGYCYVLAKGYGMSENDATILSYASQLHDIGEVAIPRETLSKSGELSPYEWEMVKQHTLIGAEILRGSSSIILQAAEVIALTHHERWDGSGYPRNLSGDSIPLSGRLCALSDVFDALTSPRPYKEEVGPQDALMLIQDASGQLFDPELVNVFYVHFNELLKIQSTMVKRRTPAYAAART